MPLDLGHRLALEPGAPEYQRQPERNNGVQAPPNANSDSENFLPSKTETGAVPSRNDLILPNQISPPGCAPKRRELHPPERKARPRRESVPVLSGSPYRHNTRVSHIRHIPERPIHA